jgi:heme/copper-type cytochrome/quinol oxidase subunit 2
VTALSTGIHALAAGVLAADWKYWLPPNYSEHGGSIDLLFVWIFWITTIIFFLVEITLVVFLIKYRQRPDGRRAVFTHGNTRLEMAWTLAPAVILIILALATKRVWDRYRYSKDAEDPNRAQVLVVGEQFKWNFVFPGPDGKLGTYLAFPKPADAQYRGKSFQEAEREIGRYINETNPLGQRLPADPKQPDPGRDDDYARLPGRPLIVPVERTIDINLSAKDVLHDFFLPTFRVKLDAVPGMRGHIVFRGKPEARSTKSFTLDKVPADKPVWLDPDTKGVEMGGNPKRYNLYDPTDKTRGARRRIWISNSDSLNDGARRRLIRGGKTLDEVNADPKLVAGEVEKFKADLAAQGITELRVVDRVHEIVCEELCGLGHTTMRGEMIMVSNQEYTHYLNLSGPAQPTQPTRPAPQPVAAAGVGR